MWKGHNKSTTPEMEDEIRKMWADDKPKCEIMRRFGLGRSVVDRVLTAHLPSGTAVNHTVEGGGFRKVNDEQYKLFKAEEKNLPPDDRGPYEQWMPRPGRSALDQMRAAEECERDRPWVCVSVVASRHDDYRDRREDEADRGSRV